MLMHVGPKQECLLFAPPPPIKYGGPGGMGDALQRNLDLCIPQKRNCAASGPNFDIHVSVSDLYISTFRSTYFPAEEYRGRPISEK
jgi:hypothetical protein